MTAPPQFTNGLIREKSPYLLQHAHNPVDWMPWNEEAFALARDGNKPIFLSIGYSTCHWCHVMERESFEDPKIADILNRNFISIKVDREERPDVDAIYMAAVQAMTGQGGWPLSVWLTPDLEPFFGGTYFPPESRWGRPGFAEVLNRIAELWEKNRRELAASARGMAESLSRYASESIPAEGSPPDAAVFKEAFDDFRGHYDGRFGGFGEAPKFPMPVNVNFLLRYYVRSGDKQSLDMAVATLKAMARGGIHDQIGGGFHRYSTDEKWRIPHFEKMLYDNAQIAVNYLEAFQLTGDEELKSAARDTLDYVARDMSAPQGGFYSAEDADSQPTEGPPGRKAEGAFYVWTKQEIADSLGDGAEMFCFRFGVEPLGNAESDPQNEFEYKNILFQAHSADAAAKAFGKSLEDSERSLALSKKKLFEIRQKRPRPHLDDKIITAWNGLMISAFAKGAQALGEDRYGRLAARAASFIREKLYDSGTRRLYRRWRDGERLVLGMAEDYAFLVQGLLDLYEWSFDAQWLLWAESLSEEEIGLFYDSGRGGFFRNASSGEGKLIARLMDDADNVEPSASSVSALNLLRLADFIGRRDFSETAEKTISRFAPRARSAPRSLPQMLCAMDFALSSRRQIVIVGPSADPSVLSMAGKVWGKYLPNKILMLFDPDKMRDLSVRIPFLKNLSAGGGRASAHVCVGHACSLPLSDAQALEESLDAGLSR